MLVLSRRLGEQLLFPSFGAVVQVLAIKRGAVRLGVTAPPDVSVLRAELEGLAAAEQFPAAYADEEENETVDGGCNRVLQAASAGLELAQLQLQAGRTQDVKVLLATLQENLAQLGWHLSRAVRKTPRSALVRPRKRIAARSGPAGPHD